jgi:hypothetical protein
MAWDSASSGSGIVAAAGPVTTFVEAAAISVGAGMLLGGFLAGLAALASGWEATDREPAVVGMSSIGGLFMALCLLIETIVR